MKLRAVAMATLVLAPTVIWQSAQAQPPQANGAAAKSAEAADENTTAIQKTASVFTEAFKRADAKAIAALWTASGEYIDETGTSTLGRKRSRNATPSSSKPTRAPRSHSKSTRYD